MIMSEQQKKYMPGQIFYDCNVGDVEDDPPEVEYFIENTDDFVDVRMVLADGAHAADSCAFAFETDGVGMATHCWEIKEDNCFRSRLDAIKGEAMINQEWANSHQQWATLLTKVAEKIEEAMAKRS